MSSVFSFNRSVSFFSTVALLGVISFGCATAPKPTPAPKEPEITSVEIEYVLGRSHYRLLFHSLKDSVEAKTIVDKQTIDQSEIDYQPYSEYLQKALVFVRQTQTPTTGETSEPSSCRTPFKVTIRMSEEIYSTRGCRTRDNGDLSKLVKQGEFLIYSKI